MRPQTRPFLALFLCLSLVLSAASADLPKLARPPQEGFQAITQPDLRRHISFLSSPELGGRYTLSQSLNIAARYLAAELEAEGYRGAAEGGSFFQPFELITTRFDPAKSSLKLTLGGKEQAFQLGQFATANEVPVRAEGGLVFVGYGISAPRLKHDDYAGLDVKGKIVVAAPGRPAGVRVDRTERGYDLALAKGAAGYIALPDATRIARMNAANYRDRVLAYENVRLADVTEPEIPSLVLNGPITDLVLAQMNLTAEKLAEITKTGQPLKPQPLEGTAAIEIGMTESRGKTQNVVGRLDGTDPKLKDEFVMFSAHYDHLKTSAKGEIYPGADDDSSGTAALLGIARAMAAKRPRRSVIIMFHSGEELGLLGAKYNADVKPVVPLDKLAIDLNIDQIGRSRQPGDTKEANKNLTDGNSVYLVGANRISTQLHKISEQTNAETENLKIDYLYNDPTHPEQIYYRSDHWHYAKHGVPIIFYFTGIHEDYHRPTDTIDKIDFNKLMKITRLVYATGWRVANLDKPLVKDVKPAAAAAVAE